MKILETRILRGPNVFHTRPVLVMKVDLEDRAETASDSLEGFTERLVAALPGLVEHHCSPGHRGGFVERLRRGTYFGHIIEHVALELSTPVGIEVHYGKTVYAGPDGVYNVVVRYRNEAAMRYLLEQSVEIVEKVANGVKPDIDRVLARAREIVRDTELGPSGKALVAAAEARKIPWRRIGQGSLIQLGYGKQIRRVQTAVTDNTSLIAADLVQDKELTKEYLATLSLPVPRGFSAASVEEIASRFGSIKTPVVVKPIDAHHGQGVVLNLNTLEEVLAASRDAFEYSSRVLVEEFCPGRDYRVLVIGGKLCAAAERTPAHVIGDGVSTVEKLVEIANRDPRRGEGHGCELTRIDLDNLARACLAKQGLGVDSVPAKDRSVFLRQTANLSTGGTSRDVTDVVHPSVRAICERAARHVGLDICGVDLVHPDISEAVGERTKIIEVNAGPGLRMHTHPSEGKARDVGGAIIDMLYPEGVSARIPIVSVTGTNGKTTVARLLAHVVGLDGKCVGLTTSDGIYIDDKCIEQGDTTGPISARLVLADPAVEFAVLETARGGLMRNGLGYDWSDVGVITNIREDHLGQDGLETVEDLVRVKSLVAERVREGGTIVLNADDPQASRLVRAGGLPGLRGRDADVIYYSLSPDNPIVREHLLAGHRAVCIVDDWICDLSDADCRRIARSSSLQFAFGGTAIFNVSNALAVTAAAIASGVPLAQIGKGLASFRSYLHNTGRSNVYKVGQGYVLLDYGHNPDALSAIGAMIEKWGVPALAVVGLPGDRSDELLKEGARAIGRSFRHVILRDDIDLRGRAPGEVPQLVAEILRNEFPGCRCEIVLDERAAVEQAVAGLGDDEVAVVFYDEFEETAAALRAFDPAPQDTLPFVPEPERPTVVAPAVSMRLGNA